MVWVEELCCWEVIGGFVKVLMLERCVELGRGADAVCIGAFRMFVSIGSVGVEFEDADSSGSPAGTKLWCSNCNGDSVCPSSSRRVIADDVAKGDGLAGREEVCLSLPKTRLEVSGSVVAATALGTLCNSMSSLLVDRANSPVFCLHLSLWYIPLLLWMSFCLPSNLSSPSGCQSSTGTFGRALSVPVGQANRNGFSGSSSSIPQFLTNWESVVKEVESNVTGEGQKTSSVLSRALSRIEMRFRQRQSDCLTEVGVKRKSYCP